jgi:hypothetical protein
VEASEAVDESEEVILKIAGFTLILDDYLYDFKELMVSHFFSGVGG